MFIYALTGDISEPALAHISKGHFDRVLDHLDFNEIQTILDEIKGPRQFRGSNTKLKETTKVRKQM